MPAPVSITSTHTWAPAGVSRARATTSTPPWVVYLMALSTRLDRSRCSRCASDLTHNGEARRRSCRPFSSAREANTGLIDCNTALSDTARRSGVITPASRRETSSMVSSDVPNAFTARIRRVALVCWGWPCSSFSITAPNRAMACSGWRRSWLAEAKKRVFSSLTFCVTAICRASSSASASFSKRDSSASLSTRFCCRAKSSVASRCTAARAASVTCSAPPCHKSAEIKPSTIGNTNDNSEGHNAPTAGTPPLARPSITSIIRQVMARSSAGRKSQGARPQTAL